MLALLVLLFIFLIFLGMDLVFASGLSALIYLLIINTGDFPIPLEVIPQKMMNGVDSFPLMAIPFFMLAGELMNKGGITRRLVDFSRALVGHITGGLAQVNIVANMIMAGMSGSANADCAATGAVLIPAMVETGYPADFAAAVTASASTVGPVIPPSIGFVLFGAMTGVSVGRLFLGGAIPGVLMGLAMMIISYLVARREGYPRDQRASFRKLLGTTREALGALLMPLVIIGGIVGGIMTPTEASAIAVCYSLVVGFLLYRELSVHDVISALVNVGVGTAAIMIIVSTVNVFSWMVTIEQMGPKIVAFLSSITNSPYIVLALLNLWFLILGCIMAPTPIYLLVVPILVPLAKSYGIDLVHLGVFMTVNLMLGLLTPPVGINLFIVSSIARVPVIRVAKAAIPYMIAILVVLLMITYLPSLTTWLPNLLMP